MIRQFVLHLSLIINMNQGKSPNYYNTEAKRNLFKPCRLPSDVASEVTKYALKILPLCEWDSAEVNLKGTIPKSPTTRFHSELH
jgi:hypothetical protein